ncbi:hypothetical protein GGI08_002058 [Coemansia sp. S2]|nr:hypothetical protein LPJ71_001062 [Coemansia sp. S17]KAJ2066046.1 hypothetical protein GGI08_002058 [Coemansia sp. S2]KAJ2070848.1 hypothetical protein GGH13_003745 [Coemansia sp. S155-1]KAJ2352864.1 hypothetical protein GGH92_001015 [Coemansia sp. RSA 2673]
MSFDHLRTRIDQLVMTQQLLLACMEVNPQASQVQSASHAICADSVAMDTEQLPEEPMCISSDEGEDEETVEPLSSERIGDIKRDVSAKKSTWATLRKQYPPGKSALAPLSLSDRGRADLAVVGVTDMDTNLAIDEAYSQAATMAAYGVELLSIALSGPEIDRKRVRQAKDVVATLCATLIETRSRRRNVVTKMIEDRVANFKHASRVDRESDSTSGTKLCEQSRQPCSPSVEQSRVSAAQQDCSTPNMRLPAQAPDIFDNRQARESVETIADAIVLPTVSAPASAAGESASESASETGSTSIADLPVEPGEAHSLAIEQKPTTSLCRQEVIRDALLRQGMSESDIVTYFNQFSNESKRDYDSVWKCWVIWCDEQGLDPLKRSIAHLETYTLQSNKSKGHTKKMACVIKGIWSIVEGRTPPVRPRPIALHGNELPR